MADWRKLSMAALLAEGKIDEAGCKVLKKELWEDGKIDDEEVKFLIELREAAQRKAKAKKEELTAAFNKLKPAFAIPPASRSRRRGDDR